MNKIRDSLNLFQFIITATTNVINTILFFIVHEFTLNYHSLKYLTSLTLYFNSTYLFLAFTCDVSFFIFSSNKLENFNYFLRYKFCNIINPISYLVFILFWILVAAGGIVDAFKTSLDTLFSIYATLFLNLSLNLLLSFLLYIYNLIFLILLS